MNVRWIVVALMATVQFTVPKAFKKDTCDHEIYLVRYGICWHPDFCRYHNFQLMFILSLSIKARRTIIVAFIAEQHASL